MKKKDGLPDSYLEALRALEVSYLETDDPIRQSGFGGGAERWREERSPILEAVESDGDILDVGCANGYLLECLVRWGHEQGLHLIPHGVDIGSRLIELARRRLSDFAENLHVGNGWDWEPPRRYQYVYTVHECVPTDYLAEYIRRTLDRLVEPGGRLIVGSYGSRSQRRPPFDIVAFLGSLGYHLAGSAKGGRPPITLFAWIDGPSQRSGSHAGM
jgi:SAM-dependent methyltransferase